MLKVKLLIQTQRNKLMMGMKKKTKKRKKRKKSLKVRAVSILIQMTATLKVKKI
uniref:Uncharacterized protein n=1 Tax=Arundo donax TaxID=35708 RepID=A0A0A9AIF2_ARUDO